MPDYQRSNYDPACQQPATVGDLVRWAAQAAAHRHNPSRHAVAIPLITAEAVYLAAYAIECYGLELSDVTLGGGPLRRIVARLMIIMGMNERDVYGMKLADAATVLRMTGQKTEHDARQPCAPGEGGAPPAGSSKGIPLAEAKIRVREWLAEHAKANPDAVTRDAVAAGTGVSAGQVSKTTAWRAFRARRDAEAKPGAREVPLTAAMKYSCRPTAKTRTNWPH